MSSAKTAQVEQVKPTRPVWPDLLPVPGGNIEVKTENDDGDAIESNLGILPVLRVTGPHGVGKSTLGCRAIARRPGDPHPPVVYWDFELSASVLRTQYAMTYYDMTKEYDKDGKLVVVEGQSVPRSTAMASFIAWGKQMSQMEVGQYAVAIIDPFEDLEDGIRDYMMANLDKFGLTAKTAYNGSKPSPEFWNVYKKYLRELLTKLASKVQTVIVINHLRNVWEGNAPVKGKFEPRGSDAIHRLATLSLWLTAGGANRPPKAAVIKNRLNAVDWDKTDDYGVPETVDLIPSTINAFDFAALRKLFAGAGTNSFTEDERRSVDPSESSMTEFDRQAAQAAADEARRLAAAEEYRLLRERQKTELMNRLVAKGFSRNDIGAAAVALKAKEITFDSSESAEIYENQLENQLLGKTPVANAELAALNESSAALDDAVNAELAAVK